ncbi:hypothetical protein SNOG_13237 [Parastagonospora nodorum SN15]|uniref:Uncharacterized protein n=1 Tax=Phaeosphaeria nodorum (strain SN15 / ATCC MYA-4574 / FGSC 10173) TaxID=321614 RepID=Q0U4S7_PHANO|nr:hypothetical protein SNOG_13237 [Parastagonospora nodorum SN15]EAT79564.1 hypothetical protein SNOG_13237 [Parastagonospora nodorum SN15]
MAKRISAEIDEHIHHNVCKPTDELAQPYTSLEKYGHVASTAARIERTRSGFAIAWFRYTTFQFYDNNTLRFFSGVDWRVSSHDVRQLAKVYEVSLYLSISDTPERGKANGTDIGSE